MAGVPYRLDPTDIIECIRRAGRALSITEVTESLGANKETVTWRMRRMVLDGQLEPGGKIPSARGDIKLYRVKAEVLADVAWRGGSSLESVAEEVMRDFVAQEVGAALVTWARWVRAGRPQLDWGGNPHLAMSQALDKLVGALEPHKRSAVEFLWGLRDRWGWQRYDLHETYDEALSELRSVFRLPS